MARFERSQVATIAAVSVLAAGLGLAGAAGPVGRREVSPADVSTRVTAAAAGAAIGASAVVIVVLLVQRRNPRRVGAIRGLGGTLVLVGAVVCGLLAIDLTNGTAAESTTTPEPATLDDTTSGTGTGSGRQPPPEERERPDAFGVDAEGTVILLAGLALLIGAVVMFARRTETRVVGREGVYLRSDLEPEDELDDADEAEADLGDAVRASRQRLDGGGSPVDRILAAYATMLDRFTEIGLARHRSEPPGAYVARCLRSRPLPAGPTETLLELFELARFSRVVLTEDHVGRARQALDELADQLDSVTA